MKWLKWFKKKEEKKFVFIRATKKGWHNPDVVRPKPGSSVKIDCGNYGEREAIYLPPNSMLTVWKLTDCTHPIQNTHMSDFDVMGWKPIDDENIITLDTDYEDISEFKLIGNK